MTFAIIAALLVLAIVVSAIRQSHYGIGKVKISFTNTETGRAVRVGNGNSIGAAMADGFYKLYCDLSEHSTVDTIRLRYDTMVNALEQNRNRMFPRDISVCESYIKKTSSLLEKVSAEFEKQQRSIPEHRRFVAEQRRLMKDSLRYDVLARDGFRCQICGATADDGYKLHVDHILPVSKGGKTEMSNLRTLCERCNMGKSDKIETISMPAPRASVVESPLATALRILQEHNEEYVDKTSSGGALYFYSDSIAEELKGSGLAVSFAPNGTKGTGHRPAWFVK